MKRVALALALSAVTVCTPAVAHAGPTCEWRSRAHIAEHGGQSADSAWHVAHGERPTCDRDQKDDNGKSRFCRKHWYC